MDEAKQEAEERIEMASTKSLAGDATSGSIASPLPEITAELERKLYRKIDVWLMPILTFVYLFGFLDRGE